MVRPRERSFRFSVRSDVGLLRGGALLLVRVVALLVRVVARLSGGVALPGAVFAVSLLLFPSSKKRQVVGLDVLYSESKINWDGGASLERH
jgi:hypothetical protein